MFIWANDLSSSHWITLCFFRPHLPSLFRLEWKSLCLCFALGSIYLSSLSISLSLSFCLLQSARDQYWCSSKASVAKVLNWHDRAIKEHQRSIPPSFTLPLHPVCVHLIALTDRRQRLLTHFLHLCSTLSDLSLESHILFLLYLCLWLPIVLIHCSKVVCLVKKKKKRFLFSYCFIIEWQRQCWLGLSLCSDPAHMTQQRGHKGPSHDPCVCVRLCVGGTSHLALKCVLVTNT